MTITAPAQPEPFITNDWGMSFVLIQPGPFKMGKYLLPTDFFSNEVLHPVKLTRPYYLQTTPVTQAQWLSLMGTNPSKFTTDPQLPVDSVSWSDAQNLIRVINEKSGGGYRLPSEAEWEYGARAGSDTHFYFGSDASVLEDHAWFQNNAKKTTHPVAQKLPNAWGLYDLYGNVWEWVQDYYAEYPLYALTDPTGPAKGSQRVLRGGCYLIGESRCNSYARGMNSGSKRKPAYGFRLAKSL